MIHGPKEGALDGGSPMSHVEFKKYIFEFVTHGLWLSSK